ncbi:DNA-formamidopyrimidine glycosylase, partial [candidate division KSB1 bacterium]|nr:DNA-formamidopyrimidine glycosylase [candidate division KSB1 bacterium]
MNQSKVCGIGNIYANEILFRAKIHPQRVTNTMTSAEIDALAHIIPAVLCAAIDRMGTTLGNSVSDFRTVYNIEGDFQSMLNVYGLAGEPCKKCGNEIKRIVQKGRSSFFCEHCQK